MSITVLVFLLIYFTGLVLAFRNPVYGVMTYIFEWHNHPPYMWWGHGLPDLRWSLLIATVTLISFVINYKKLAKLEKVYLKPVLWILLIVVNTVFVSLLSAVLPDESFRKSFELLKVFINLILMILIVRTHNDYKIIIWILILCIANFGRMAWEVGANRDLGFIAPNATEENAISAHVMTILPFIGIYFLTGNRWQKIVTMITLPFALNLIILANSRGTMLGVAAIALGSLIWIRGKARIAVAFGLLLGTILFFQLTNQAFWDRQETTTQTEKGGGRFEIWSGGLRMLNDYPLGVGGEGFVYLSMDYIPEIDGPKSQHNTFIAVLTDWGYIGFILYMGFLIHIFSITFKIKSLAKKIPQLSKFFMEATALQLAIVGISIAGLTHSRQYAEIVYWLGAFVIILRNIQYDEYKKLLNAESIA